MFAFRRSFLPSKRGPKIFDLVELHGDDAGAAEYDAEVAGLPVQEVDDDLHARLPVLHAAILVGLEVGHVREGPLRRKLHRSRTKQVY